MPVVILVAVGLPVRAEEEMAAGGSEDAVLEGAGQFRRVALHRMGGVAEVDVAQPVTRDPAAGFVALCNELALLGAVVEGGTDNDDRALRPGFFPGLEADGGQDPGVGLVGDIDAVGPARGGWSPEARSPVEIPEGEAPGRTQFAGVPEERTVREQGARIVRTKAPSELVFDFRGMVVAADDDGPVRIAEVDHAGGEDHAGGFPFHDEGPGLRHEEAIVMKKRPAQLTAGQFEGGDQFLGIVRRAEVEVGGVRTASPPLPGVVPAFQLVEPVVLPVDGVDGPGEHQFGQELGVVAVADVERTQGTAGDGDHRIV